MVAGDKRANQNAWLTIWQIIFPREHNRVARILCELNPKWTDEQIYQVARKIVIAEYQNIVYNEWLEYVIGEEYMEKYNLRSPKNGSYSNDYNYNVHPNTMKVFNSAAFRVFHSLIPNYVG